MPKSRFNAVREKARASRHNPLQRNGAGASSNRPDEDSTLATLAVQGKSNDPSDVLPILKSLPLPNTPAASSTASEDVLWAITSLTGFLSTKALRNELLSPKHDIVARVLFQLQGDRPIEVREAASGCLRNLCIEAPGKARKTLETNGCIRVCIQEVQRIARQLNLIEGSGNDEHDREGGFGQNGAAPSFLNKPKSEMNRKERRQAAKAEAAAAKKQEKQQKPDAIDNKIPVEQANGETPAEKVEEADEDEDEKTALRFGHLANLTAVIWCLAEISPESVGSCERAAPVLCRIFARTTVQAVQAIEWLQANIEAPQKQEAEQRGKIDVGKKDRRLIEQARVDAATVCLNALVTLSDSNVNVCAAFVGLSKQEVQAAIKGKGKVVFDEGVEDDLSGKEGDENMQALYRLVQLLSQATQANVQSTSLTRQATSVGLLALATMRNIQSSLPSKLRSRANVSLDNGSKISLSTFETTEGIMSLQRVVSIAASGDEWKAEGTPKETSYSKLKQRQEDNGNLTLALEVLAELIGDREGWNSDAITQGHASRVNELAVDDEDSEDEEMKDEDDASADDDDIDEDEMDLQETGASAELTPSEFEQNRLLKLLTPNVLQPLTQLAYGASDAPNSFAVPDDSKKEDLASSSASTVRNIVIRSLSVLSNALIVLASYAQPPPSQPAESDTQRRKIADFHAWMSQSQQGELFGKLWRWSFELASRAAASPLMSLDESSSDNKPSDDETSTNAAAECKRIVASCLHIMWSLSRCYEGVSATEAGKTLVIESAQFAADARCSFAQQGNGVVDSLLAAYKASKQEDATGAAQHPNEVTVAAVGVTDPVVRAAGGVDDVRAASLGVLSTIVRQPHVWPSHLATIVDLLVRTLEALPLRPKQQQGNAALAALELRDWTSLDGMVIAVNGLIDTFADETKPWDTHYTTMKLQGKLKRLSADVRLAARSVDKRKQAGLRLAADECWDNLIGFLKYRDGLRQ